MSGSLHGGRWTQWGRGDCEGYSLWLGGLVRAQVVRNTGKPRTYRASVNQVEMRGDYASVEAAKEDVERWVIFAMRDALADWAKYIPGFGLVK